MMKLSGHGSIQINQAIDSVVNSLELSCTGRAENDPLRPSDRAHRKCPENAPPTSPKRAGFLAAPRAQGKRRCVGLYTRVSTHDQQTLPMQCRALREYVSRRGWTIAIEVKEVGSGAAVRELRQKVIDAARRREIDAVVVWRLDR